MKIDPKSIGVGQYQHDVNQSLLAKKLDAVVEDCGVNSVGVDVNLASRTVANAGGGLSASNAQISAAHREQHGALLIVRRSARCRASGRTFEQCAGAFAHQGGSNPLDASAVHPESYALVQKIIGR